MCFTISVTLTQAVTSYNARTAFTDASCAFMTTTIRYGNIRTISTTDQTRQSNFHLFGVIRLELHKRTKIQI